MADEPTKPSHESLIEQAASNGWDFFDGPSPEKAETEKRMATARGQRMALLAAALDRVPEFRELLAFIAEGTLHKVVFVHPLGLDPMQGYAYGQFREGQNASVFAIYKLIAQGREQELKGREP